VVSDLPSRSSLHPMIEDAWESDRCPDCGIPGERTGRTWARGIVIEMFCPVCEPDLRPGREDDDE
jgi:hypothetical protein